MSENNRTELRTHPYATSSSLIVLANEEVAPNSPIQNRPTNLFPNSFSHADCGTDFYRFTSNNNGQKVNENSQVLYEQDLCRHELAGNLTSNVNAEQNAQTDVTPHLIPEQRPNSPAQHQIFNSREAATQQLQHHNTDSSQPDDRIRAFTNRLPETLRRRNAQESDRRNALRFLSRGQLRRGQLLFAVGFFCLPVGITLTVFGANSELHGLEDSTIIGVTFIVVGLFFQFYGLRLISRYNALLGGNSSVYTIEPEVVTSLSSSHHSAGVIPVPGVLGTTGMAPSPPSYQDVLRNNQDGNNAFYNPSFTGYNAYNAYTSSANQDSIFPPNDPPKYEEITTPIPSTVPNLNHLSSSHNNNS